MVKKKFLDAIKNEMSGMTEVLIDTVIGVAIFAALVPVIVQFLTAAQGNLSGAEAVLLGLTTLFLVMGLIVIIAKRTGLIKKN